MVETVIFTDYTKQKVQRKHTKREFSLHFNRKNVNNPFTECPSSKTYWKKMFCWNRLNKTNELDLLIHKCSNNWINHYPPKTKVQLK